MDINFKCDLYKSCPDNSDQINCIKDNPNDNSTTTTAMDTTTTTSTTTTTTTTTSTTTSQFISTTKAQNMTTISSEQPSPKGHAVSFFIILLIILSIITAVLTGIWVYGRRKRKWREFLAQLDNNTDWEYEQLDDGPSISASRTTMSPVFNMNIANDDIEAAANVNNNNNSSNKNRANERTPIR